MTNATLLLSRDNPEGGRPDFVAAVRLALSKGLYFEFSGGLGDIINSVIAMDMFRKLDALKPNEQVVIVLACHNPDAPDLFLYHHLSKQLFILSLGAPNGSDPAYRKRHGLPPKSVSHTPVRNPAPFVPRFSESDRAILTTFPDKFVAFSVTASGGTIEDRSIPSPIYTNATQVCLAKGLKAVFLGKRYPNLIHGDHKPFVSHNESEPPPLEGVISAIDRFSVSGSLECVRRSVATVVCNSAIMNASFKMRKPTFYITTEHDWGVYQKCKRLDLDGYGYGLTYPENTGCPKSGYTENKFSDFLDRTLSARR